MKFDKKKGMVPLRLDHFGDRVKFVGDLEKNDMSITLSEVEVKDEGYYHCNIINHPDRNAGRNNITLLVVLERTLSSSLFSFSRPIKERIQYRGCLYSAFLSKINTL
jgi:hypothetical protein